MPRVHLFAVSLVVAIAVTAPASARAPARANAVTAWNANAGEAALAACIAPADNPLSESRMYAMTHVAIHDALNAIRPRSQPYVYDARAKRGSSPDAAVAAAARDVLVPVLGQLHAPFGQACIDAGVASVQADYAAALDAIPDGPPKDRGVAVGQAAAAAVLAPPGVRRRGHHAAGLRLPAGRRSRRVDLHARPAVRLRPRMGSGHAVRARRRGAVPARTRRTR